MPKDNPNNRIGRAVAVAAVALLLASAARAEEVSGPDRFDLWAGCDPVFLVVGPDDEDAEKIGVTHDALTTAARSRLRAARLYVDHRRTGFLVVTVVVVETAALIRTGYGKVLDDSVSGESGMAITWSRTEVGLHGGTPGGVMSIVSKQMDEFIDEYLRVNAAACEGKGKAEGQ